MKQKREVFAKWHNLGKRTKFLSLMALGLVLGIGAAFAFAPLYGYKAPVPPPIAYEEPEVELAPPLPSSVRNLTVLLIGTDSRPGEPSISNTDTLVVAQVNAQMGQIALLSVPRDTQVEIPRYGTGKINTAARVGGGLDSTKKLIEKLLGLKIDGYVMTDFAGFKETIDTLGGITLTVEKDMYYETGDQEDGVINLRQGTQRLNGTQALQYARYRQDALADISRTMRQQTVLKAAAQELVQLKTLPKLPKLIPQIVRAVKTDLNLTEMLAMANVMVRLDKAQVISQTLPGNFVTEKGISYWQINSQETQEVARNFFTTGKTVDVFSRRVASQVAQGDDADKTGEASGKNVAELTTPERNVQSGKGKNLGSAEKGVAKKGDTGEQATLAQETETIKRVKTEPEKAKLEKAQDGIVIEVEILAPTIKD